jgi:DNA-binding transcriptional MerR regulator
MTQYYTLSEFAGELKKEGCAITRNKLRYYEREGLITAIRMKHGNSEYRYYSQPDIHKIKIITLLLSLSWKAKDIASLLKLADQMREVVGQMEGLKTFLLVTMKSSNKIVEDKEIIEEIKFWRDYKADFKDNKMLPKSISNYSKIQLDKSIVENNTVKMIEKSKVCLGILEKYYNQIKENEKEILKLTDELVDLTNRDQIKKIT